jgi:hypothetical protein
MSAMQDKNCSGGGAKYNNLLIFMLLRNSNQTSGTT